MFGKVVKPNNGTPDELEKSIGEALLDLEVNSDLKTQLRELYITGAKEMEVGDKKKCLIVFVPVPLLKSTLFPDPIENPSQFIMPLSLIWSTVIELDEELIASFPEIMSGFVGISLSANEPTGLNTKQSTLSINDDFKNIFLPLKLLRTT